MVEVDDVVPFRLRRAPCWPTRPTRRTTSSAARDALAARSEDAEVLSERCLDHELGWWAAQEIGALLGR